MDIISIIVGALLGGVPWLAFACWRLRGDRGMVETVKALSGGGPRPTVPK